MENNKEKLKSKLKKKKEARQGKQEPFDVFNGETDIVKMMENVNKILKSTYLRICEQTMKDFDPIRRQVKSESNPI